MTGSSPLYLDDLYNHNNRSTRVIRDHRSPTIPPAYPIKFCRSSTDRIFTVSPALLHTSLPCYSHSSPTTLAQPILKPHAQGFGTNNGVTQLNNINTPQDCCVACIINPICDASVFSSSARICFQVAKINRFCNLRVPVFDISTRPEYLTKVTTVQEMMGQPHEIVHVRPNGYKTYETHFWCTRLATRDIATCTNFVESSLY